MRITSLIDELKGKLYRARKPADVKRIVIHHSASTAPSLDYRGYIESIDSYHRNKHKWPRIAYHYVIDPAGTVYKCNPILTKTYHAKGANTDGVGIMLIGNFDEYEPSDASLRSARALVQEIRANMPAVESVIGHRDVKGSSTACPGKHLTSAMIAAMW